MGFWGSLFGGSNSTLSSLIPKYGSIGDQQTGAGTRNQNTASDFWTAIASGDATKQMQALAPEISAAKTSNQQTQKTNAMFGTRSGGTAASNASSSDKLHSDITNLIGSLTNNAVSGLASLGSNQISTGLSSLQLQQGASQQQMENWSNSIAGLGLTYGAGFGEKMALSTIPGFGGK